MSAEVALTRGERLLDRANAILVREIQQALSSRLFLATLSLAVAAILVIGLSVAAAGPEAGNRIGRAAFAGTLSALAVVAFLIVPFQAFLSTRAEVTAGTIEHLLLTHLTPGAIVRGKLLAALTQFLLFLSLFGPLLALTFLLRGVDIPTIAFFLLLAILGCLCATSVTVALGAASFSPRFRALPHLLATAGLGFLTLGLVVAMGELHRLVERAVRDGHVDEILSALSLPALLTLALSSMVASSFLSHPYENRSTRFRLLALLALAGGFLWVALTTPSHLASEVGPAYSAAAAGVLFLFVLFAVTEVETLSPRVRTLVPRSPLLALLAAPFLPGGGRGLVFAMLLSMLGMAGAHLYPLWVEGAVATVDGGRVALLLWLYVLLYGALGRLLRARLADSPQRTLLARALLPLLLAVGGTVPVVFDALFGPGVQRWHLGHLLNPIWTAVMIDGRRTPASLVALGLLAGLALLLAVPSMVQGIAEVLRAAKERRSRAR